jgi:benzoyl-CoA reductase/2-hydroxyglutaryl-CoA dehydratase subunit BcrC/BadD/HgdB
MRIHEYFDGVVRELEARLAGQAPAESPRHVYALEVARLGRRLYAPGERIAWCGLCTPFELLQAMGVTSCFVEFVGGTLAGAGTQTAPLEAAEQAGYSTDTCGYHRAVTGAAAAGLMPVPEFLVATTAPCTAGLTTVETLARTFGRDLFVLHVPLDDGARGVAYLAGQYAALERFVAAHTGEPPDRERLRATVERSNRARALLAEVYDLARRVPTPAANRELANFGIVLPLLLGTEAAVDVARAYRDAFAARAARGTGGVPGERLRLLWVQNRIQFRNPLVRLLEERGAAIVVDELNGVWWEPIDPDEPFAGLARRAIDLPLHGTVGRRVARLQRLAREYRVDGAVHPCHWGCRQGTGIRGLIQEGFREIGVPVLNLEVDCIDARSFAEGQLRTRLEAFLEMLAGRPSPWRAEGGA